MAHKQRRISDGIFLEVMPTSNNPNNHKPTLIRFTNLDNLCKQVNNYIGGGRKVRLVKRVSGNSTYAKGLKCLYAITEDHTDRMIALRVDQSADLLMGKRNVRQANIIQALSYLKSQIK